MTLFQNKYYTIKIQGFIIFLFLTNTLFGQIPILNSYPSITNKVIYLDFDGQVVSGTFWNNGNTVNALPSNASAATIRTIFQRMSEDYRPFDVNITTDSTRFNNASPSTRIRVIFTPTYTWYGNGAGGVAYLGSFTWGGYPGTPCWIFESQLGNNSKSMAEAASHEVGHTLSLKHQSTYNASCVKTNEYNPGSGNGVTSWAPIMGVGYSKNVTLFHNGKSADGCNITQFDLSGPITSAGITGNPYLSFLPDDIGNTFQNGKILNLNSTLQVDSGLINTTADIDVFRFTLCSNRYVSINSKPWALDTTTYGGANMDVKLKLYNASGALIASDSATNKLTALVGLNLTAGSYYFSIDGDSSPLYPDYGVLGKYYLSIKTNNPPAITNTLNVNQNFCATQNSNLTFSSNIATTSWQWTVSGSSTNTYSTQTVNYNFNLPGVYTISLLANTSNSSSCLVTNTINVGSIPSLTVSTSAASICPQTNGTFTAFGASNYTWLPGNFSGSLQIVNANSNTSFTILGSNGTCSSSITKSMGISQGFTLNLNNSSSVLCSGKNLTLTPSGGVNYTLLPGGLNSIPFIVTPSVNTTYTVLADNGACKRSTIKSIQVIPSFTIGVDKTDTAVCANQPVTFFAYGAINFTTNPGGQVGYQVVVTPTANTIYTVTGIDNNQCTADSIFLIQVLNCNYLGMDEKKKENEVSIYPNPSRGELFIQGVSETTTCEIFDAQGKIITRLYFNSANAKVNTENWIKGIYLFQFKSGSKIIFNKKVVVD
jgi:hypothetical protein